MSTRPVGRWREGGWACGMRGTVWVENVAFTGRGGGCAPTHTGRGPTRGMRMLSRSTVSLRMAWNVKTVRRPGIFMMVGTSTSIALCRVFAGAFADTLQGVCRAFAGTLGTWHEHAVLDDRADLHTAKTRGVLPCRTPLDRSCVAMWVGRGFFVCLSVGAPRSGAALSPTVRADALRRLGA